MEKFYLQIIANQGDSVEHLSHIIWPIVQEASIVLNTVEQDSIFFKPALFIILNIFVYLAKMSLEMDMETEGTPFVITFSEELIATFHDKFFMHTNTLYPTYSSLCDVFGSFVTKINFGSFDFQSLISKIDFGSFDFQSPISKIDFGSSNFQPPISKIDFGSFDFQSPASKINLPPFLDSSLAIKLGLLGGVKGTYSSLKSFLNRDYLNSLVPETNFRVYTVHSRYVRIQRSYLSSPFRGHRIEVIFSRLLSTIYNNPIQDVTSNALRDGLIFQVESEFYRTLRPLPVEEPQADPVFSRGPYQLPADSGQLLSAIDFISILVTDLGSNSLPISRTFLQSIVTLSYTLNPYNEARVTGLIEDIQEEWRRNDTNGIEFVRIIRILRALESAYRIFHPNFVSQVEIQWFETI